MTAAGPAVAVVASEPEDDLAAVLLRRTLAWAAAVAPGADYLALAGTAPDGSPPPARRLAPPADPAGAGAMALAARLFDAGHAPVLLATLGTPMLTEAHATAALDDLNDDAELVIGPLMGGGWYLLGLARPMPELAALPAQSWKDPDVMTLAVGAANQAGLTIGLLRPERRLATAADIRAARVDPLVPEDVRAVLAH